MSDCLRQKTDTTPPSALAPSNRTPVFPNPSGTRESLLWLLPLAGSLSLLGLVLWYCRYGIGFEDETFYLIWISNPFIYSTSMTHFGFIYHPLYELLGGNIAALRQVNTLITFILAWIFAHTLISSTARNNVGSPHTEPSFIQTVFLSGGFAAASLSSIVLQGTWLPTPSYNTLSFQALLFTAIGMLLADNKTSGKSLSGWMMIGIGGWLAFMSKPTTAAALGVVVLFYLIAAKKIRLRLFLISMSAAAGLLVVSALMIDGSVTGFIHRLQTRYDLLRLFYDGYSFSSSLQRVFYFPIHSGRSIILYAAVAAILIAAYHSRYTLLKSIVISALIAAAMIVIFRMTYGNAIGGGKFQFFLTAVFLFFLMLGIPFTVLCFAFFNRCKGLLKVSPSQWVIALCLFVFPLVYSFGTSGDCWYRGCSAGLFWILSALFLLIIMSGATSKTLLPFSIATTVIMTAVLLNSLVTPFRQPEKLWKNNCSVKIGGSSLILAPSFSQYINTAVNSVQKAGFRKGTPVIDLSGISPGTLFVIGAASIGEPWIMGNMPNSARVAVEFIKKVPSKQIAESWVLVEPEGPYAISPEILQSFGADITQDYEVAASWSTPADGFFGLRVQKLFRPTRPISDAITACELSRGTGNNRLRQGAKNVIGP